MRMTDKQWMSLMAGREQSRGRKGGESCSLAARACFSVTHDNVYYVNYSVQPVQYDRRGVKGSCVPSVRSGRHEGECHAEWDMAVHRRRGEAVGPLATVGGGLEGVLHPFGDLLQLAEDDRGSLSGGPPAGPPGNIKSGACCTANAANECRR